MSRRTREGNLHFIYITMEIKRLSCLPGHAQNLTQQLQENWTGPWQWSYHSYRPIDGMEPIWFPFKGHEAILLFLRRSAMMNAISSDCEALSLGSQWVWYRELRSSNVTVRDPPMHSVTFCPVISRCTPPGWLPSCSWTSKKERTSAWFEVWTK